MQNYLQKLKKAVDSGKDLEAENIYLCPVCGFISITGEEDNCPICKAKKRNICRILIRCPLAP